MSLPVVSNEPPSPLPGRGLVRLRIDLAYDGTMFAGWGIQPELRTLQGDLETALGTALHMGRPVQVVAAGRTDAGVHARGQVVHSDVPETLDIDFGKLRYSLNGLLESDFRIRALELAPYGFDARFSALSRKYTYEIADGLPDPLTRNHVVAHWCALDVDLMNAASAKLLGLHDFTSYCRQNAFRTSIRELEEFSWHRTHRGVLAVVQADAFCHSMVRSLVGAVVAVGEGRRPIEYPREILDRQTRSSDAVTMPGHGLVLDEVIYPAAADLLARQDITRNRRETTDVD